ncbi:site-specific integrase [Marinobacter salarius]|uniref:site-specific integrase n=1 Tax=Marinobacter salarius TaxID=1420917 RepID=UPI00273A81C3|nr:site-specific integrase [Marinobacter salarius]MDP4532856.1 site-specific integrase [Marinobacter salarius]
MSKQQLYRIYSGAEYPSRRSIYDGATSNKRHIQPYYSFSWPSGEPCHLVEMFLQDKARTHSTNPLDGGTVKLYAAQLSHLVRFCYKHKVDFIDLSHSDIEALIAELADEQDVRGYRKRNNNTIKSTIATIVCFLCWIQEKVFTQRPLIGIDTPERKHQIKLVSRKFRSPNGYAVSASTFASALPNTTTTAKQPMPSAIREKIWEKLVDSRAFSNISRKLQGTFSDQDQRDHLRYMHARRELQLILLEATGLRPQELVRIRYSDNVDRLRQSQLAIPTLKRRERKVSYRVIPIDRQVAMKVETFIFIHRNKLIARLKRSGIITPEQNPSDTIYLSSETGMEVKPDAAYQEFRRLCASANLDQRSCQSMFRHRFITNMVKLHLITFVEGNPHKNRHMMTESDYRTILQKIASFTGHKSADSLLHYIDLAWDELDAFSSIYDLKELQDSMRSICFKINEFRAEIHHLRKYPKCKLIEEFERKLFEIYEIASAIPKPHPIPKID